MKTTSPNRKVTFSPHITFCPVLHVDEYTDDEIDSCWYYHEDEVDFRSEARFAASLMDKENAAVPMECPELWCTRGLEGWTAKGATSKQLNKFLAISTVLQQQQLQFQAGIRDERQLAKLYTLCSYSSGIQARLIGVSDSLQARREASKAQDTTTRSKLFHQRAFYGRIKPMHFSSRSSGLVL